MSGKVRRCGGAIVKIARFSRRKNGDPPWAITDNRNGRPITQGVIARVKRAEKEPEAEGRVY